MFFDDFKDIPVLPLAKTQVYDVRGFEAVLMGYLGQFHREVLVDEKARRRQARCLSITRSESGLLLRQAGFRGRPRRGCAFA